MYCYSKELNIKEEATYTVLPLYIVTKVRIFLDSLGIEYKILIPKDFPEGINGYDFLGEKGISDAIAFETHIDEEQLHEIAEELDYIIDVNEIAEEKFVKAYGSFAF